MTSGFIQLRVLDDLPAIFNNEPILGQESGETQECCKSFIS